MGNLYLVGFMGSGKSTVGKIIAYKTGYKFVDIDKLIEERENKTIPQIFKEYGESYFRQLEKHIIQEFTEKSGYIVSTGGGLGADIENMKKMKKSGTVVWLDVSLDEILKRTEKDSTERPLLKNPREKIEKLYKDRKKVYSMADIHIKAENKSPEEIAQEILDKWSSLQE